MGCTTGTNAKGRTLIYFPTGMVMIGNRNECHTGFALIHTRFLVAARVSRQRKHVQGKKKANHSHSTKISKKQCNRVATY